MSEEIDREKCRVRLTKILDDEHIDKYAHIMRIIDDIFIVTENNKDQLVREIEQWWDKTNKEQNRLGDITTNIVCINRETIPAIIREEKK